MPSEQPDGAYRSGYTSRRPSPDHENQHESQDPPVPSDGLHHRNLRRGRHPQRHERGMGRHHGRGQGVHLHRPWTPHHCQLQAHGSVHGKPRHRGHRSGGGLRRDRLRQGRARQGRQGRIPRDQGIEGGRPSVRGAPPRRGMRGRELRRGDRDPHRKDRRDRRRRIDPHRREGRSREAPPHRLRPGDARILFHDREGRQRLPGRQQTEEPIAKPPMPLHRGTAVHMRKRGRPLRDPVHRAHHGQAGLETIR